MIQFPASPADGETFTVGNRTWLWDGGKWTYGGDAGPPEPPLLFPNNLVQGFNPGPTFPGLPITGQWRGVAFVPNRAMTFNRIGMYKANTAGLQERVFLVQAPSTTIRNVNVTLNGQPVGQFAYTAFAIPITLIAGQLYYLWSEMSSGQTYLDAVADNCNLGHCSDWYGAMADASMAFSGAGPAHSTFVGVDLMFEPIAPVDEEELIDGS
jgi:hypothetical protein